MNAKTETEQPTAKPIATGEVISAEVASPEAAWPAEEQVAENRAADNDLVDPEHNDALASAVKKESDEHLKKYVDEIQAAGAKHEEEEVFNACLFIANNQLSVNNAMAGADWVERAQKHEEIDYRMATLDELQEFWNCAWNFKWWDSKNSTINYPNARMELVDILHFITSEDLASHVKGESTDEAVRVVAQRMSDGIFGALGSVLGELSDEENRLRLLKRAMMVFINSLSSTGDRPVYWAPFWIMVMLHQPIGMNDPTDEVSKVLALYRAKAVLNKFRTVHRKSAAGYKKVWIDGREDNDIMMSWLEGLNEYPGDDALNRFLEQTYSRVIGVRNA